MNLFLLLASRTKASPAPPVIPEGSSIGEVKVVKPSKDRKFNNERLVLVTPRYVPFLVCSIIPYTKNYRMSR